MDKDSGPGERINQAMLAAGLTQAQLSRRLGVTPPTVHNWINGGHGITWANARRVGQALNVSPGWIMFGADTEAERQAQNSQELGFLRIFRELDSEGQAALLRLANSMAPSSGAPPPRPIKGGSGGNDAPRVGGKVVILPSRARRSTPGTSAHAAAARSAQCE